jgi:putative flippase GtrA
MIARLLNFALGLSLVAIAVAFSWLAWRAGGAEGIVAAALAWAWLIAHAYYWHQLRLPTRGEFDGH